MYVMHVHACMYTYDTHTQIIKCSLNVYVCAHGIYVCIYNLHMESYTHTYNIYIYYNRYMYVCMYVCMHVMHVPARVIKHENDYLHILMS